MKIVILAYAFPPAIGGVEKLLSELAGAFDPSDVTVIARATRLTGEQEYDSKSAYKIHRAPLDVVSLPDRALMRIYQLTLGDAFSYYRFCSGKISAIASKIVEQTKPDLILCGYSYLLEAAASFKKSGAKLAAIAYGTEVYDAQDDARIAALWNKADAIVSISSFTAGLLEQAGVDRIKIKVLPPGVDPSIAIAPSRKPPLAEMGLVGKRIILTVSRLHRHKGTDTLIKAMPSILKKMPDARLVVVGDGPYADNLKALAKELGMDSFIQFTGALDNAEKYGWYAACDVFAMASRRDETIRSVEGFGYTFLEAGAFGKPVVAGNSGGVPDAVENGVTGLLVDPLDAAAIADAILKLLGDSAMSSRFGAAARSKLEGEWGAEKRLSATVEFLELVAK